MHTLPPGEISHIKLEILLNIGSRGRYFGTSISLIEDLKLVLIIRLVGQVRSSTDE
jgi:hypothetical protein